MSPLLAEIEAKASELSEAERLELAERLFESCAQQSQHDIESLWIAESEARVAEIRAGKSVPVPGREALDAIRNFRE